MLIVEASIFRTSEPWKNVLNLHLLWLTSHCQQEFHTWLQRTFCCLPNQVYLQWMKELTPLENLCVTLLHCWEFRQSSSVLGYSWLVFLWILPPLHSHSFCFLEHQLDKYWVLGIHPSCFLPVLSYCPPPLPFCAAFWDYALTESPSASNVTWLFSSSV